MNFAKSLMAGGWTTPKVKSNEVLRKYSITTDVLGFRRCSRQYGMFQVRGFSSANATQLFFGTLVHDVLDRIHRNHKTSGRLPEAPEIETLVDAAAVRLVRAGIRTFNINAQKSTIVQILARFVDLIGPHFFKHVQQTEFELERALKTPSELQYVLHGVVDVLGGAISHDLGLANTTPEDIEIWDYKSGKKPENKNDPHLQGYTYQMQVYAELYRQQTGHYPARCVLVFLGELGEDAWEQPRVSPEDLQQLFHVILPESNSIAQAMEGFHTTVQAIEHVRSLPYEQQWQPPTGGVDDETCKVCDFRYSCSGCQRMKEYAQEVL